MADMQEHSAQNISKKLSAVFEVDSFFYGVFDEDYRLLYSERKSFEKCKSDKDFLKVLNSIPLLNDDYASIQLCCKTHKHLFTPTELGVEINSDDNFSSLISNKFLNQSIDVTWSVDDQLISAVQEKFPRQDVHHISSVFADYFYPSKRSILFAHFEKEMLHILHYSEGSFKFYNSYQVKEAEDYLYFVMQSYKLLGLDPAKDPLRISGDLFDHSSLFKLINRYVVHLEFMKPERLKLKKSLPENVKHRYFDLYSTVICE